MNRFPMNPRAQAGVTMIELLVVMTIGGILAAVAVPGLRDMLRTTRQSSAFGLVMSDLNLARGEAIKRNARMLMCARDNAVTNVTQCGTDWRRGWLVCVESTATADTCSGVTAAVPIPVVAVRPPLDSSLTMVGSAAVIRFNPNSSQGPQNVPAVATLTVSGTWSSPTPRIATIAATGNITR